MSRKDDSQVRIAFSYDTEMAVPKQLPAWVIAPELFEGLPLDQKKMLWGGYLLDGWQTDPEHLQRSIQELEMIRALGELFAENDGAMTSFILGEWLDLVVAGIGQEHVRSYYTRKSSIEVGSHSFNHRTFGGPVDVWRSKASPNLSIEEVDGQLRRANEVIEWHLGTRPLGLRTPMGNVAPLDDVRILEALRHNGIRYVSSWLKAAPTELNSPAQVQPFFYEQLGYGDILEIPGVGKYDVHFIPPSRLTVFGEAGRASSHEIVDHYIGVIETALRAAETAAKTVYVPLVFHPWATVIYDPDLSIHRAILAFCKKEGVKPISYAQVHQEMTG